MAHRNNSDAESKPKDRKAGRRAKQLEAMEKKAKEENAYFSKCQQEAKTRKTTTNNDKSESQLFEKQGSHGINFSKYDEIKVEVKHPHNNNDKTVTMQSFDELALPPQLKRNVTLMKYTSPTPIQRNAIPLAMAGEDLMCCAQTGSGKTCAFLLPVIAALASTQEQSFVTRNHEKQQFESAKPRCVVLAPTRELASQIELEAQKLTYCIPSVRPVCVYGGANPRSQLRDLAFSSSVNALVVVATPGRLTDFCDRSIVSLSHVQYLIFDEADRMLDMGFEPQIRKLVIGMTPKQKRQTMMFSATFPPEIQKLAAEFLRPYGWIAVGRVGSTTDSITQVIVKATPDKRQKLQLVVKALESGPDGRTLIFVQKKRSATWLKKQLNKGGPDDGKPHERFTPIPATDIHGDRSQSQREAALASFRSGKCRVLVATDVAARGLDVAGVEHVINMDLPNASDDFDSYVHRIGRTGRAGHVGLATSLYVPGDDAKVGNGKIAGLLITQLRESGQDVPEWLEEEVAGCGGITPTKRKQQFGGSDVRPNGGRGNQSKRPHQSQRNDNNRNRGRGRGGRGGRGRSGS